MTVASPGELLVVVGRGFDPEATLLFGEVTVPPLPRPLSDERRLVVVVPQVRPGVVTVAVETAAGRSGKLELTILPGEGVKRALLPLPSALARQKRGSRSMPSGWGVLRLSGSSRI